jgi:hypothetical protein
MGSHDLDDQRRQGSERRPTLSELEDPVTAIVCYKGRRKKKPGPLPVQLIVGAKYRVTNYHTGDFEGVVTRLLMRSATLRITDAMNTQLEDGDVVEIPIGLANFVEQTVSCS